MYDTLGMSMLWQDNFAIGQIDNSNAIGAYIIKNAGIFGKKIRLIADYTKTTDQEGIV